MITFAVVGHNEAALLELAVRQSLDAAGPEDRVLFVDSGSTDDSVARARALGVGVIEAPLGKGNAVTALLESCSDGVVCTVDGDTERSEVNIPLALADAWRERGADLIVGDFHWPEKSFLVTTVVVYEPLVASLFPEAAGRFGSKPLSGFRLLDPGMVRGPLPGGFALEAYLNAQFASDGRDISLVDLGRYSGPLRAKLGLAEEVGGALLDLAERRGRIAAEERPAWDAWLAAGVEVAEGQPPPDAQDDAFEARMTEVARRPVPA